MAIFCARARARDSSAARNACARAAMVSIAAVSRASLLQIESATLCILNTALAANGCRFMPETQRWEDPPERGGMVPTTALDTAGWRQYHRFMAKVDEYADAVGTDGRPAFAVPVDASSTDLSFRALDNISMVRCPQLQVAHLCIMKISVRFNHVACRANGWMQMGLRPPR